ncbi:unnamed protein product [Discula destructiva]
MSTKYFTAAPNAYDLILESASRPKPLQPTDTAPIQPSEALDPTGQIMPSLENMAIFEIPSACDDGAMQELQPTSPELASQSTNRLYALTELFNALCVHPDILTGLEVANNTVAKDLTSATARLDELETEPLQMQGGNAIPCGRAAVSPESPHQTPAAPLHANIWSASGTGQFAYQWHDMSDIAATLAAAPKGPSSGSSRKSSSSFFNFKEGRPSRPHREEHVKRSRITYDCHGGQTPDISPTALSTPPGESARQKTRFPADGSASPESCRSTVSSLELTDEYLEIGFATWLIEKAKKALFGE